MYMILYGTLKVDIEIFSFLFAVTMVRIIIAFLLYLTLYIL